MMLSANSVLLNFRPGGRGKDGVEEDQDALLLDEVKDAGGVFQSGFRSFGGGRGGYAGANSSFDPRGMATSMSSYSTTGRFAFPGPPPSK